MRFKLLKLCAFFLLVPGLAGVQAQESTNATGGNASGSGGSAGYSVGLVVYHTFTGATGSLAEGVQQPYEISLVTAVENAHLSTPWVTAYPNPATNKLTLKVTDFSISRSSFQLYDMTGKLLLSDKIPGNHTILTLENLMPGIYFLKVIRDDNGVKVIKIIKR